MRIHKTLAWGIAAVLLTASSPNYAEGIPVFDFTAKIENAQQWAKEAKQWMETVEHYKAQMNAYKDQLATATGLRDIQGLLEQGKSLQSEIKTLQKQGISLNDLLTSDNPPSGALNGLYEKYKAFDVCDIKTKTVTEGAKNYLNVCKQETANKGYSHYKNLDLSQKELILRLIKQIPEKHFRMIRYFGFLANRVVGKLLDVVRNAVGQSEFKRKGSVPFALLSQRFLGVDPFSCILCGERMRFSRFIKGLKIAQLVDKALEIARMRYVPSILG